MARQYDNISDNTISNNNASNINGSNILIVAVAAVIIICVLVVGWQFFIKPSTNHQDNSIAYDANSNPEAIWIYVAEHYENINDSSDKISIEEYRLLLGAYQNAASLTVVEAPIAPQKPDLDAYMFANGGYQIPGQPETWVNAADYKNLEKNYKQALEEYKTQLAEYNAYQKATTNPEETYHRVAAHYRNRNNLDEAISIEEFNNLKIDYSMNNNQAVNTPILPFNPADYWIADSYGDAITEITNEDGSVTQSTEQRPMTYRNKLDGRVISYIDYDELANKYIQDVEEYNEQYKIQERSRTY